MVQLSSFISAAGVLALAAITEARVVGNHHMATSFEKRGADVTPSAPGPGSVFKAGGQCPMEWGVGTASRWKSMTIDLMTGDNQSMVKVTNVATDIDGTTQSSHTWTCPEVDPNAPVYFYQFTDKNGAHPAWTTRFTIASDTGAVVAAPNPTQPDGSAVPWGIGKLANGSSSSSTSSGSSDSQQSSGSSSSSSNTSSSNGTTSSSGSNGSSNQSSSSSSAPQSSQSSTSGNRSASSGSSSVHVQVGAILSTVAVAMGALLI